MFEIKPKITLKINFGYMVELLSLKDCPIEINQKILIIVDHFIYLDVSGQLTIYLVKHLSLIDRLWGLRASSYLDIMNIFCNLAL